MSEPNTKRFELRPYQAEAIEAVEQARVRGLKRALICLPTGAGKTVIFSELAQRAQGDVIVLAHREELLQQAKDKLERALQGRALVDIEQGPNQASPEARVVVCSIRSLREERLARLMHRRKVALVIYDECHHAAAEDNMRVMRQLGVFEPDFPGILVGFTATTKRGDGKGLDGVFDEIIFERDVHFLIEQKYLVPLKGYRIATQADLSRVGGRGGEDFNVEELAEAVDIQERNALVARAVQELARDRRTIIFCVTVSHAKNLSKALNQLGVPAGMIHGMMKKEARAHVLENFREGRLAALTNVGVLTEGFDDPGVSCIAMARPTRSSGLYTQCVGRGTRLSPDKTDCLVLDFVDLSDLSLVTLPSLFGMPRHLDLEGEEVHEAQGHFEQLMFDYPGFEVEAVQITLAEIQRRAEHFDPLTQGINPEVLAISANAWSSLGSAGLVLYYHRRKEKLSEVLVIDSRQRGKSRWQVIIDGEQVTSFSRVEEAIEAVDYEIEQAGPVSAQSAHPSATWRQRPPTERQLEALSKLKPPRHARNISDALHYLSHAQHAPRQRWGKQAAPPQ